MTSRIPTTPLPATPSLAPGHLNAPGSQPKLLLASGDEITSQLQRVRHFIRDNAQHKDYRIIVEVTHTAGAPTSWTIPLFPRGLSLTIPVPPLSVTPPRPHTLRAYIVPKDHDTLTSVHENPEQPTLARGWLVWRNIRADGTTGSEQVMRAANATTRLAEMERNQPGWMDRTPEQMAWRVALTRYLFETAVEMELDLDVHIHLDRIDILEKSDPDSKSRDIARRLDINPFTLRQTDRAAIHRIILNHAENRSTLPVVERDNLPAGVLFRLRLF